MAGAGGTEGRAAGAGSIAGGTYSRTYSGGGSADGRRGEAVRAAGAEIGISSAGTIAGRRGAAAGGGAACRGAVGGGAICGGGSSAGTDRAARLGGAVWADTSRCSVWASFGSSPSRS